MKPIAIKLKNMIKGKIEEGSVANSRKEMLSLYLKSRGMNPEFVSKDMKDSHAKTNEFKMWLRNHQGTSQQVESVYVDEAMFVKQSPIKRGDEKEQRLKSARIIKAIYKHHNVKEDKDDIPDWEDPKDENVKDKPYGIPPKIAKDAECAAVIKGGETLTGEVRDDIKIDPKLKTRPGQTEFTSQGKKSW